MYAVRTIEVWVAGVVDDFDVFDRFGGALIACGFEFFFSFCPVGVFIDWGGWCSLYVHDYN